MSNPSIVSPEDQGATFVELFFDLVFVFAVTGLTHYAAHHLDWYGILRSAVIFWLIRWGWTQFTWALNAPTRITTESAQSRWSPQRSQPSWPCRSKVRLRPTWDRPWHLPFHTSPCER